MSPTAEFALIKAINDVLAANQHSKSDLLQITVDSGDDAAAMRAIGAAFDTALVDGEVVSPTWLWTIDTFTDGVHFRTDWVEARDIGIRAIAASASDIIAMGARPAACLVALSAPESISLEWIKELAAGMANQSDDLGARLIGGDVSQSPTLSLCVTFIGLLAADKQPVTRRGAKPGDVVAVCGDLGSAAAGLALLASGQPTENFQGLVTAYRRPVVDAAVGERAAAAGATSMIDVSDGLIADLGHIASASGVDIEVTSSNLTPQAELITLGELLDFDAIDWVLTGGDSHAIAATFSPATTLPAGFRPIGVVASSHSKEVAAGNQEGQHDQDQGGLVTVDGKPFAGRPGYQHFL